MKSAAYNERKKYLSTVIAIGEGVWNGVVVSGVLAISAFLVHTFWIF